MSENMSSGRPLVTGRTLTLLIVGLALILLLVALLWTRRLSADPPAGVPACGAVFGVWKDDLAEQDRISRERVMEGVGSPNTIVAIADWDPATTWAFRVRNGSVVDEGV